MELLVEMPFGQTCVPYLSTRTGVRRQPVRALTGRPWPVEHMFDPGPPRGYDARQQGSRCWDGRED